MQRYLRVIQEASVSILAGGEEALQMKDIASRAGIALATLYRYFPSKQQLILAVAIHRMRDRQEDLRETPEATGEIADRAAQFFLQHLRTELELPLYTASVRSAAQSPEAAHKGLVQELDALLKQNLILAAGPFTEDQLRMANIVVGVTDAVASSCITGAISTHEARFQVIAACQLFNLPSKLIQAMIAAADVRGQSSSSGL